MKHAIKSIFKATKSTILLITLICLITFMVNNRDIIKLEFFPLPITIETRLFIIILASFLTGFLCAVALLSRTLFKNFIHNLKINRKKNEKPVDLQS